MRVFVQEWSTELRSPATLVVWAASSLIFGVAGPLGTFHLLPVAPRIALWMLLLSIAILVVTAIRSFVQALLGLRDFWRGSSLIAALSATLLTLPFSAMAGALFSQHEWERPQPIEIGAFIFFAALGIGAYRHTATVPAVAATEIATTPSDPPGPLAPPELPASSIASPPRLVLRLDAALQGRLISVSVRDHYVDVVTENGSANLLMRLGDAIAETEGEAGMQIHRSHWVAEAAVRGIERAQGKLFVVLSNGSRLPVSRANRDKIERWEMPSAGPL